MSYNTKMGIRQKDLISYASADNNFVVSYADPDGMKQITIPEDLINSFETYDFDKFLDTRNFGNTSFLMSGLNLPFFIYPYLDFLQSEDNKKINAEITQTEVDFSVAFALIVNTFGAELLTRARNQQVYFFIAKLLEIIKEKSISVAFPYYQYSGTEVTNLEEDEDGLDN